MKSPRSGLRRYPALAYLGAAAALALLLPSGLIVPQTGPPTLAEYAPVPGEGTGRSDTSDLGQAGSGGFGAGTAPGTEQSISQVPSKVIRKPGTKRCVGNPPRQAEDPLSPPCIAFFEGDNFGGTGKGVSRDEVTVVVRIGGSQSDNRLGQIIDCNTPPTEDDGPFDLACKAYMRYFNDRFQTYERIVHLWSTHDAMPSTVESRLHPFAYVSSQGASSDYYKNKTFSIGYNGSGSRASNQKAAPYFVTFRPDSEDQNAMVGSYLCDKLAHRPARFTNDPTVAGKPRKFGIWQDSGDNPGPRNAFIKVVKDRCDVAIDDVVVGATEPSSGAKLHSNNVTTVILFNSGNLFEVQATNSAAEQGWFPEWFVPSDSSPTNLETNSAARLLNQAEWANAVGVSVDLRRDAITNQPWYRAYREGCPDCRIPSGTAGSGGTSGTSGQSVPFSYDALAMLFHGIQAAGPRLTAANIDKGLHAIPPKSSDDPYRPAAYFSPGNYSFIKDSIAIWWDPTGFAPGATQTGCYRLPQDGRRRRAGEWPAGDNDAQASGPCQGDTVGS